MSPLKASFYVYAENDSEIMELQKTLHDFVVAQYNSGNLVTADKLTRALKQFGNSPLIKNFLAR